jgi:HPr kinase/phosphorylase
MKRSPSDAGPPDGPASTAANAAGPSTRPGGGDGDAEVILHATTVSLDGRGALILGPSGSGKSTLALAMMASGAALVADDRTIIRADREALVASCPARLSGLIEARGIGLLNARPAGPARLSVVVDLGSAAGARLPDPAVWTCLGRDVPLVRGGGAHDLAPALMQLLRAGPAASPFGRGS